ncbi:hypothetical protein MUK42_35632 [Musa troglodytarum]|uniref:Uncharacterized protein n=1 Tax=Musa troglodytarum TaxID=320322 RepID=A0A9E7ECN1_9LILI|nr:hypothetical protein MUK42_35632 [Musa troglodytarum]
MKWTGLYCKVFEPDSVESTRTLRRSGLGLQSRALRSPHEVPRLALRPLILPPLLPPSSAAGKVSNALHTVSLRPSPVPPLCRKELVQLGPVEQDSKLSQELLVMGWTNNSSLSDWFKEDDLQPRLSPPKQRGSEIHSLCNGSEMQALINIKGCFFGGRMVHASFYGEERFRNKELASMHGETN